MQRKVIIEITDKGDWAQVKVNGQKVPGVYSYKVSREADQLHSVELKLRADKVRVVGDFLFIRDVDIRNGVLV